MIDVNNIKLLLIFTLYGIFCGICVGLTYTIFFLFKRNSICKIILDTLTTILIAYIFIIATNIFALGQIRGYLAIIYLLSFYLERKTIGKTFAKLYFRIYNLTKEKWKSFSNTKVGKILKK